jgi:hypothetical protein
VASVFPHDDLYCTCEAAGTIFIASHHRHNPEQAMNCRFWRHSFEDPAISAGYESRNCSTE